MAWVIIGIAGLLFVLTMIGFASSARRNYWHD